jgi:hypothetical protein
MNQTPPTDDVRTGPADNLDRLLSEFFKAQMPAAWPAAPATPASEPSVLAAERNGVADAPRNQPAAAARDTGGKSRYTLAASVAILLGTCWWLSNGFQPGERGPGAPAVGPTGPPMLDKSRASDPDALKELRKDKALNGDPKAGIPKIELK